MTTKTNQNPWLMDVRVRERNLKSGALSDKDLEKHLGGLPDLDGQYESFGTSQPALAQPHGVVHAAVASPSAADEDESDSDIGDDESTDESNDDSSDDVGGDGPADGGTP